MCLLTIESILLTSSAPVASPDDSTQLSYYLNNIADHIKMRDQPLHRQKRSIVTSTNDRVALEAIAEAEKFEKEMVATDSHSRKRRSAAFFLHAAMKLCETNPHLCRSIELSEGGMRMSIKISEA